MRERSIGLNEGEPMLGKWQRAEKGGRKRERHYSSANIVDESG
jgi:hypothetical protein